MKTAKDAKARKEEQRKRQAALDIKRGKVAPGPWVPALHRTRAGCGDPCGTQLRHD